MKQSRKAPKAKPSEDRGRSASRSGSKPPTRSPAKSRTRSAANSGSGKSTRTGAKRSAGKGSAGKGGSSSFVTSGKNGGLVEGNGNATANGALRSAALTQAIEQELTESEAVARRKVPIKQSGKQLSADDLSRLNTNRGLMQLLKSRNIKLKDVMASLRYEEELVALQVELVKLQRWVQEKGRRLAVLFEGRDAAGKGGAIRRFTEHLNPRSMRVVALPKPSEEELGQWYFQRYSKQLPNAGEIVFFDRSWYNRAVVEPVNGFCSSAEYDRFMQQVTEYEHMLYEDGVVIIKFWFSISREEQQTRFDARKDNPLKQWKLSPIDSKAQELWDKYSHFKELMFSKTHTSFSPWIIVKANDKKKARLESIRYVLNQLDYGGKNNGKAQLCPDPNIVTRYHRQSANLD